MNARLRAMCWPRGPMSMAQDLGLSRVICCTATVAEDRRPLLHVMLGITIILVRKPMSI